MPSQRDPKNPAAKALDAARGKAAHCRSCDLWKDATQTVFGEGKASARIMLLGEQPGDQEDLAGQPFVGPAGRLLDEALQSAGIDRDKVYVTNTVKHFKFMLRGKRRIHKKPLEREIAACMQWLDSELQILRPSLIIALGATATRALFGRPTTIESVRGKIIRNKSLQIEPAGTEHVADLLVTIHPSAILRMPGDDRKAAHERFIGDLKLAARYQ
jgi:uracil-DNA glycosylase family protein